MDIIDLRDIDELQYNVILKILSMNEKEMEMFKKALKEKEPEIFRRLFPDGGKKNDAT